MPIESTWAEFWKVEFIPGAHAPVLAGRLFMTPARLGAAKAPMASPLQRSRTAKAR